MRMTTGIIPALLFAFAAAAADASPSDFATAGWSAFLSELFHSFDTIGFILLTLLLVVLGMCADLMNHLRLSRLVPEELLGGVQENMENGEYEKALELCEKSDSLIGQVFAAALSKSDYSFERMEEAMRGEVEIQGLVWRQWVAQFRTIAAAGILLGAIGAAIESMRFVCDLSGRPNAGLALASSFEMRALAYNAFTAVALGCLMAVAALLAHGACASKLEKILLEAKRLGEELLDPFRPLPLPPEE